MININNFDWPQWIMIGLHLIGLIMATVNHDKPRSNENAYHTFIGSIVGLWILAQGGFFK